MGKIVIKNDNGTESVVQITIRENGIDRVVDISDVKLISSTVTSPPTTIPNPPATPPTNPPSGNGSVNVTIATKEVAGSTASSTWPTTAIIPLPYGAVQNTSNLMFTDAQGNAVPSQFEIINRHAGRDNSIRHIAVHYQPTLETFTAPGTGIATNKLVMGSVRKTPTSPVTVIETATAITLSNSLSTIVINKSPFGIIFPTGKLESTFYAADASIQKSFDRSDITTLIEERGPMRSVVKISAPTIRTEKTLIHGWAIRIYMYASKQFVKLDFQLQNCDMTQMYSSALNFDGHELSLVAPGQVAEVRTSTPVTVDPSTLPMGVVSTRTSWGVIRNFQQMYPAGLRSTGSQLIFDLWPRWSAQHINGVISPAGLYTLDDLQCVVKEMLIGLTQAPSAAGLQEIAKAFQYSPVAVVPKSWYEATQVTLDMGGVFPVSSAVATDRRLPDYSKYGDIYRSWAERTGYNVFGCDNVRRVGPATAGGWPYSNAQFMVSGDPADYFYACDFAMAELNCMPEWFINYKHAADWNRIKPTENPYQGSSWRNFDAAYGYTNNAYGYSPPPGYPVGTPPEAKPRDDQHGWFYHVEEAYNFSGNLWIKDWYTGIAEFRKTRLNNKDPWPDHSGRATGHSISHALQAYRVTGDTEILGLTAKYVKDVLAPLVDPILGGFKPRQDYPAEAMFQIGYLCRALISYMSEQQTRDQIAYDIVGGFVKWNLNYSRYGYYNALTNVNQVSDATSMSFCDTVAWWLMQVNDENVKQQLSQYLSSGLGGGQKPYIDLLNWKSDFLGRWVTALKIAKGGTI